MKKKVLACRRVVEGKAEGYALVSTEGIGTFGCLDDTTGIITERGHCIQGQTITDKILVFPQAKGSSAWAATFLMLWNNGKAPAAMLISTINSKSALGAVLGRVPTVSDFDIDPLTVIETGDWVEVNADEGLVTVTKKNMVPA